MRDPARIPRIMEKLQQAWETSPDLRLGQLLINIIRMEYPTAAESAIWITEDDRPRQNLDWETMIDNWIVVHSEYARS